MPFLASTSKRPTAVLGVVTGFFLGNNERTVLLNRLNVISLFGESGGSPKHLGDFSLFASIKFVEALPFFYAGGLCRHVVFLLSVKQEVSIVGFRTVIGNGNDGGNVEMLTLFHGDVDTCFHQQRVSEVSLCSSGMYRTLHDDKLPLVAFSLHRGSVVLFDPAAAVASYSVNFKSASQALESLFPHNYVQSVLMKQKRRTLFTHGHFNALELDVRSIAFGYNENEKGTVSFYVLYNDSFSKTHVSEYVIDLGKSEEHRRSQGTPNRLWIPDAVEIFPAGDTFRRKGVLLPNVESNASLLHVVSEGLFVIGPQLIAFISWKSATTQTSSWRNVTTLSFPPFSAYIEPVCCASLPNRELLVLFWDGTCVQIALKEESERPNMNKLVLLNISPSSPCTVPDSLAVFGDHCVVGSRMADTFWMNWRTRESTVLLGNCGPVFDITVAVDGPRFSVIASTGVGLSGGLSLVRSAVNVRHDVFIGDLPDVKRVCFAGNIMILSFLGYSRICYCMTEGSIVVEELSETPFETSEETLSLALNSEQETFLQVTRAGLFIVKGGKGSYSMRATSAGIEHAHIHLGMLIFADSTKVFAFHVSTLMLLAEIELEDEVSCLTVASLDSFLIGEWTSASVSLYTIVEGVVHQRGRFICSSVPYSICVLPFLGAPRLLVGLLNGYLVHLALDEMERSTSFQETMLMMQPVQLFNLESYNAVLCLGEVPLIIIVSDTEIQLTGIDFNDVAACAIVGNSDNPSRFVFFSRTERALVFGNIMDVQKLNITFLPLKATVTRVKYLEWWNIFVLSARRNEKDQVLLMMGHEIISPTVHREEQVSIEFLENERCVFLEPVIIGEAAEGGDAIASEPRGERVILIGTTFAFPDEQLSRSSRFMWCYVEQSKLTTEKPQLRQHGSKDVEGALQCCCVVPNYVGRIALGINGCVALYSWNTVDSTFVAEETVRVGTIVTRLVPLFREDSSSIAVFDVRQGCFLLQVDTIQGSLSIVARDSDLRGVMDGTVLQYNSRYDMCFGDDFFNFFCMSHNDVHSQNPKENSSQVTVSRRLITEAQYHLGDLVTAVYQGSFAPCSVVNNVVPVPNTLVSGFCGPQIVFGTSHGAFGTITPVGKETYLILRALEIAVSAAVPALGGFTHAAYREVLRAGQERGLSRNASFEATNPEASNIFRSRRMRYRSKGVCSGDLIEAFLTLPENKQRQVVQEANQTIKSLSTSKSIEGELLEHSDLDGLITSLDGGNRAQDEHTLLNDMNSIFAEKGLPSLPLEIETVRAFIRNLQRTH